MNRIEMAVILWGMGVAEKASLFCHPTGSELSRLIDSDMRRRAQPDSMVSQRYLSKTKGGAGLCARQAWRPGTAALPSFAVFCRQESSDHFFVRYSWDRILEAIAKPLDSVFCHPEQSEEFSVFNKL